VNVGGTLSSKKLKSYCNTKRCQNPEHLNLIFTFMKTSNLASGYLLQIFGSYHCPHKFTLLPSIYSEIINNSRVKIYAYFSYIHHCRVAHRNKLPSRECELFVSCGDDEKQTSLEWDRSSNPVAPPDRVSHTFSLK
jgi:hypothetical protein